jgi:UDP-4-amino-4,6-dideoxy-N-acetyl-beta-L-altrosamine transaminase
MKIIPYGTQEINQEDIDAVIEVLRSSWLTQGPAIEQFEAALAAATQSPKAIAVSNATAALHITCLAMGLGPGDILWTSPNTFVASANCARYCGATVDFVDIDPRTYNMSVDALAQKLKDAAAAGQLPKIVIPVHFSGQPCDMAAIHRLSQEYGFRIIEDAAHALGARYRGQPVGCCAYSDATILSFHPVKIITTGEGGAVLTRDAELADRIRILRSHGITRDSSRMKWASEGAWYYHQVDLGFNYRMTDIQAALGVSQLTRLADFLDRRRERVKRYQEMLEDAGIVLPFQADYGESAWHLYVIQLSCAEERKYVFDRMREAGILVNVHYIPVHLQPYYRDLGFAPGDFPEAERYYSRALSLPMFPGLTNEDQSRVVERLRSAVLAQT